MLKVKGSGKLPVRATQDSVGYDIFSNEDVLIPAGKRAIVGTGISIQVDIVDDFYIRIAPRSGLALNYGIDVLAGVVDKDYRGEIKVILFNSGTSDFQVKKNDKIVQIIIERCIILETVVHCESLNETDRNENGFGSSGY